jgi:G6PDH family F420-dependent oxidoreductase
LAADTRMARRQTGSATAMTEFGYTAMCEQTPVKQLVSDLVDAEAAGFDFSVMSDHYFPWIEEQGHSGYAWSVLGAAAQATRRLPLMTFVTCPTTRYHPAVVAQKAATMGVLSDGRFSLGLGSGENLNEHVIGQGWPMREERQEKLSEALDIIRALFSGEYTSYQGRHFRVAKAKLFDLPDRPPAIHVAASGPVSVRTAAQKGDGLISVEPLGDLVQAFDAAAGPGKPKFGQLPISYDTDADTARARARKLWRWGVGGWKVNAELPDPEAFDAYSATVTEDDITSAVSCGPDVETHVEAVKKYVDAGFTHVALVAVGADQQGKFMSWASKELLPALREL